MRRTTPEFTIQTLFDVSRRIMQFLRDVGVEVYMSGITEADSSANAIIALSLTNEAAARHSADIICGRVPMTELEKKLYFSENCCDPKPPVHYGNLEITLAESPLWGRIITDSYPWPVVILYLTEPQCEEGFEDCAIWRGADNAHELDSAVRRLLSCVEDYYAQVAAEQ